MFAIVLLRARRQKRSDGRLRYSSSHFFKHRLFLLLLRVTGAASVCLARRLWGQLGKRAIRAMEACGGVRGTGRLPANPQLPRSARQVISRYRHFAVIDRASTRIRLSLRINISLIIGEIYKMDFSIQFSSLYLPMKYLAIISRHPVYMSIERMEGLLRSAQQSQQIHWVNIHE